MPKKNTDFELPSVDELFSSQEVRDNANTPQIKRLPIDSIDDFPNHPFKVKLDDEMNKLIESISENGVLTPALVRPKDNGRYEMVSGHRRKFASEQLKLDDLYCVIKNLTDEEATIIMVDSNIQRENVLPSEKAYAYKMRLDAMNRQGERTDLTFSPVGKKLRSAMNLSENVEDSKSQIYRYIRLTYLIPELLEIVDEGRIKLRPAVELSYLDECVQKAVFDEIIRNDCTPSHDQTIRMRKLFNDGKLTPEVVSVVMEELKPNQREKVVISGERFERLLPKNVTIKQREDYVCKALEHYNEFLRRQAERKYSR